MVGPKGVWIVAAVLLAAGACGGSETASPETTRAPATTVAPAPLVGERRPMTQAERERIDGGGGLDCGNFTARTWDFEPIGSDDPVGRSADDALRDAIADINQEPATEGAETVAVADVGWVELVERPGGSTFIAIDDGQWTALVMVGGDPDLGVWRHNAALVCLP